MADVLQVAIDGNSGSGKTSVSRHLTKKYGLFFVDSGTMYNFACYFLLQQGKKDPSTLKPEDVGFLDRVILQKDGSFLFDGLCYSEEKVCTKGVVANVSFFAKIPFLRQRINEKIWQTITGVPAVVNGRDIGTVVLPNAPVKIYMEVSVEHRIKGWRQMLIQRHGYLPEEELQALIDNAVLRDTEDSRRTIAPLACAPDALRLDAAKFTINRICKMVDRRVDKWLRQKRLQSCQQFLMRLAGRDSGR